MCSNLCLNRLGIQHAYLCLTGGIPYSLDLLKAGDCRLLPAQIRRLLYLRLYYRQSLPEGTRGLHRQRHHR